MKNRFQSFNFMEMLLLRERHSRWRHRRNTVLALSTIGSENFKNNSCPDINLIDSATSSCSHSIDENDSLSDDTLDQPEAELSSEPPLDLIAENCDNLLDTSTEEIKDKLGPSHMGVHANA